MKIWIFLVLMLVLVAGCSKTKVIRLDQTQIQQVPQQTITKETNSQSVQQNSIVESQQTINERELSSEGKEAQSGSQTPIVNLSKEYTITSCCDDGRLFAQAKQERASYSAGTVKDLLIQSYHNNCDKLKDKSIQRVYLRFKNDIQDTSYLTYMKPIDYKRLQVDYLLINEEFEACS